jgi:hypothetical protein
MPRVGALRGGGRAETGALPAEAVRALTGGAEGGARLDRVTNGSVGVAGVAGGSDSEIARTRAGGGGGRFSFPDLRGGGGGADRAGVACPILEGLAGGGGGALPGVVGGGGTFLLGECNCDCTLLRGGMAGTGRGVLVDDCVGDPFRTGIAGDGRAGGAGGVTLRTGRVGLEGGLGVLGKEVADRNGKLGVGRLGGNRGGDGIRGGGGGTTRDGGTGVGRLGGDGAIWEDDADLTGGGGLVGVPGPSFPSRLGIEGGLPNAGGFAMYWWAMSYRSPLTHTLHT